MSDPNLVFDAIEKMKATAEPGSIEDGEFFMTVGDNLYPRVDKNPTEEEFDTVMSLFNRTHLQDLKVNAIRGNHDCYFDENFELRMVDKYE